jgi:hypothetical protein
MTAVMGVGAECSALRNNASYEARMYKKVSMETGVQDGFLGYFATSRLGLDDTKCRRRLVLWRIMRYQTDFHHLQNCED